VEFLADSAAQEMVISMAERSKDAGWLMLLRAYSLDQPRIVTALGDAAARGARVEIIADASQAAGKSKIMLQQLKALRQSGCSIRLARGTSVRDAYAADGRETRIGGSLRGIHHAKSALSVSPEGTAWVVAGSCNFSTSSRSNQEAGLYVTSRTGSTLVEDWRASFARASAASQTIEGFENTLLAAASEAGSRRNRGPPTATVPVEPA
jgi:phosphatidylserine/phosphatidylglycerophosphate/cardiolipin synthase-like enzyme